MKHSFLEDIAIRWEDHQWRAYNIGKPKINCSENWSTGLGAIEVDEIFTLFRHSNLVFLPCRLSGRLMAYSLVGLGINSLGPSPSVAPPDAAAAAS
jgi:hypothetical protein